MMEVWFIHAFLSSTFVGLYSFFLKISAEKKHSSSLVSTYSMFVCSALGLVVYLFSVGNAVFYFIATITRIEGLRHIDTTLYFPLYKTFGPILLVSCFFLIV